MAEKLGMSVKKCQIEVSSKEFAEWIAIENIKSGKSIKRQNPQTMQNIMESIYGSNQ